MKKVLTFIVSVVILEWAFGLVTKGIEILFYIIDNIVFWMQAIYARIRYGAHVEREGKRYKIICPPKTEKEEEP